MNTIELMVYFISGALLLTALINYYEQTSITLKTGSLMSELNNVLMIQESLSQGERITYFVNGTGHLKVTGESVTLTMKESVSARASGLDVIDCTFSEYLIIDSGGVYCA